MAVALRRPDGTVLSEDQIREIWKPRIERARAGQKPHIGTWLLDLAFAAGQSDMVWDPASNGGRLRKITDVDPRYKGKRILKAERINEYRQALLGELSSDDDRPQLLTAQDSETAEEVAKELNQAVGYGWEHEWGADSALEQARQYCVDLGTAALRCRWDPGYGKVVDHVPVDQQGQPITPGDPLKGIPPHPEHEHLAATGQLSDGSLPQYQAVHEGRTCWEPYTAIQILSPPGVNHEDRFPWFALVRPADKDSLVDEYGDRAANLQEDTDIASAMGLATGQTVHDPRSQGSSSQTRLRDHVWLYTCFQLPNRKHPQGQVVVLASNQYTVLDVRDQLDYQLPNGDWHTGVTFLHWWRQIDRFYSRSFVSALRDPQRQIDYLETFKAEIVAKGGPKIIVQKPLPQKPTGDPLEVIVVGDQNSPPVPFPGIGPGPWMDVEKAGWIDNMAHAATLSPLKLGENPQNVDTYSQLALLQEEESGKRSVIVRGHKRSIATLVELGVYDIRRYWPDEKLVYVSGDQDQITQQTFKKASVPDFYMVKVPKGAALPRSQAAELKKIDAIWAAATQAGLVVADPQAWTDWYIESINAGVAQEIPKAQADSQTQMAEYENLLMQHGEQPTPADYDLLPTHLPIHRAAQDRARAAEDWQLFLRLQQHIDASVQVQQENMAKVAAPQQAASPAGPPVGPTNPNDLSGGAPNPIYAGPDFQRLAAGN